MRLLFTLSLICLLAAVISAKKQVEENLDFAEPETKEHVSKKYSKDYQKSHHHGGHKHKKQHHVVKEEPLAAEPDAVPKQAQVEIPEPEAALQADIGTDKKTLEKQKQREQTEDLHLQDLTYEENLKKKDKKKKGHRGTHQAEVTENKKEKKNKEPKLFADQESKNPVAEKVIEDSFEPLTDKRGKEEKKSKGKKNKSGNNKKAYEKNKDKGKKSKDSKKSKIGKNKDKKNKDKKW